SRDWSSDVCSSDLKLHLRIGIFLKVLILIGAVLLFIDRNYQAGFESLLILTITFLPLLMRNRFRVVIPHEFETIAILFIYLSLFLGGVQEFYIRYWWWDVVLHGGAGFLLGIAGFLLVYVLNKNQQVDLHLTPFFISLFAFMFAMGMGALWEIYEFTIDNVFGRNMQK